MSWLSIITTYNYTINGQIHITCTLLLIANVVIVEIVMLMMASCVFPE